MYDVQCFKSSAADLIVRSWRRLAFGVFIRKKTCRMLWDLVILVKIIAEMDTKIRRYVSKFEPQMATKITTLF